MCYTISCHLSIYMTPDHKRIFNLIVILALVYGLHTSFGAFMESFFGKLILVGAIIVASMDSPVAGGIVALLVIALARRREGFANKDDDHDKHSEHEEHDYKDVESFRRKHCRDKEGRKLLVDENGNAIKESEVKEHFPRLRFSKADCNPCDDSCDFHVTSSHERIGTEEQLRGKDSKQQIPDRKNV